MIPPGTDLKYRITTTKEGFDLVRDDFAVVIKNTYGRERNSEINTIPELMDAMQGISDDTTVIDEIEDIQDENEASDADIDSIFERNP